MRWKSNRTTAIPLTSTKGLPETPRATEDAAKPLTGHASPDEVDDSAKEDDAQLQEVSAKLRENQDKPKDNATPIPGHPRPE